MELHDLRLALQSLWAVLFDDASLRQLALSGDPTFKRCADLVSKEAIRFHLICDEADRKRERDSENSNEECGRCSDFECCVCRRPMPKDWVHLSACPTCSPICVRCRYDISEQQQLNSPASKRPSTSNVVRDLTMTSTGGGNDGSARLRWHLEREKDTKNRSLHCPLCRQPHEVGRPAGVHLRWRGPKQQATPSVSCA
jgi:hypothetical protein